MSGHSHAKTVKHQKEITDAKRGKLFSKLAQQILIAAKEKGGDPNTNSALRMVIEKAKEYNMPKENIERAVKKGTGELAGESLESIIVEAYGPGGIAIIIEGIADNKNRALGEIKQTLSQYGGKIANEGSVRWLFERKGYLSIDLKSQSVSFKKDDMEIAAIEAGAEDIDWREDVLSLYTKPEELEKTKKNLEGKAIKIESASLDWTAKEEVVLSEEQKGVCQKLFEALDELDSVQEIYCNIKSL